MSEEERISVIIPIHNAEIYLSACIQSILDQTYTNFELLLIDDGSTDVSGEICDRYAQKDSRVKVVHNKNSGVSHSRNVGLTLAMGEYIAFCDADDQYKKNYLANLYGEAIQNNADIVICNYSVLSLNGERAVCHRQSGVIEKDEVYRRIFIDNTIGGFVWNKLFKKDLLNNLFFDEDMQICEDTFFLCRALKNAKKLYFEREPLYLYRLHQTNTMNSINNMFDVNGNMKYATVYEKLIDEKIVENPYTQYIKANECVLAVGVKCDYLNSHKNIDKRIIRKLNKIISSYCGLLITKNFYTPKQTYAKNNKNCLMFERENAKQLANQLLAAYQMKEDEKRRIRNNALATASQYSTSNIEKALLDFFDKEVMLS